ncbi:hypothetical protein GJAV_G00212360 [Gymnothorax javanicus]|nr:hypothetical protein GJAV_G00212360 [Gymnothorax javanicus]
MEGGPPINQDDKGNNPPRPEKKFALCYMGWSPLDRRTTLPMLPWLVAEIRRRGEKNETGPVQAREVDLILMPPLIRCVPAHNSNSSIFIFEHKAQYISRFIHNSHDLTYFAYLIRSQPDNPESEMACHVFKATDPNQVPEVISSIRQASKSALKDDCQPKQDTDEAFYNSQKFEVLYCGRVTVGNKKVPTTLIDDCIDQFRQHEAEQKGPRQPINGQRGGGPAHASVEFILGADPLTSALLEGGAAQESARERGGGEGGRAGMTGSPSLGSFGGLAGGLQRQRQRGEGPVKAPPTRRRHASAPSSNVQPSDAEKNRTMLFQVGRFEVNLISPDTKTVVLEKKFKDISSCLQGIKQTDHFGFVCLDPTDSGSSQYVCYVFQCASESLVDEVMLTLKQAFSTAAVCRAKLSIQRHLSQLSDNEQAEIFERVQRMKPGSDQEENELVILQLRQLCESKQKVHLHIGEVPQTQSAPSCSASESSGGGGRFTLDILRNKARSSLTSSLENIFSRGASRMRGRLGSMGSTERDFSPGDSPPGTPPAPLMKTRTLPRSAAEPTRSATCQHQSVAPELLQTSGVVVPRKRSVSESETSSNLPSSFSTPNFLKSFYQGSLGSLSSLADAGALKR